MGSSGTVVLTKLLLSTYNVSMCSESFWCGSVEIHYPFYLANATEGIFTVRTPAFYFAMDFNVKIES